MQSWRASTIPQPRRCLQPPISSSVMFLLSFERLSHPLMVFWQCTDRSAKLRPRGHGFWDDGPFLKFLPSPARLTLNPSIFFSEIVIVYFVSPLRPFDRSTKLRPRGDPERDDGHSLRFLPSSTRFALQRLILFIESILACCMLPFWLFKCARPSSVGAASPEDQGDSSQGDRIAVAIISAFISPPKKLTNWIRCWEYLILNTK